MKNGILSYQKVLIFLIILLLLLSQSTTLSLSAEEKKLNPEAPKPETLFAVQVCAYSKLNTADKVKHKLEKAGIQCKVQKVRTLFKVYCGSTGIKDDAKLLRERIAKQGYEDAFVVTMNNHIASVFKSKKILSTAEENKIDEQQKNSDAGLGHSVVKDNSLTAKTYPENNRQGPGQKFISLIKKTVGRLPAISFWKLSYTKKSVIFYVISVLSLIVLAFILGVIFLRKIGAVKALRTGKMLRKHRELIKHLSGDYTALFDDIVSRLKKIGDSMMVELLLNKAATVSGKISLHFRELYDATGITDQYIKILKDSKSWKKRAFAAEKLGHIGSAKSVPHLLAIIRDVNNEDEDVRTVALRALGRIKDERAIPFLIEALGSPETFLPPRIGEILVNIGDASTDYLIKELRNFQSEGRRAWSAEILGWLEAKSAESTLIEALFDVSPEVRAKTAGALGKIKSERAIVKLTELLVAEPVPFVRTRVSQALGAIGNPSVIHYLVNILKDPEWWVRVRAVEALEQLGEKSIPSLLIALEDEDMEVRRRSALALERIGYLEQILQEYGEETYKPGLRKILFMVARAGVIESLSKNLSTSDRHLKKRIVRLLGEAKTIEAADPLLELLKSVSDWTLKARIIQSLGKLGAPKAAPFLIENLRDSEYWVRRSAVDALGMLEATKYVDDVADILADPNPLARESALRALSMLKVTTHWEKIEKLLFDPAPKVRSTALRVMRELGITVDRKKIVEILAEASEDVRVEAIKYFTAIMAPDVIADIIRLIPYGSDVLRKEITEYIRKIKPESFNALTCFLNITGLDKGALATLIEIASIIKDSESYNFILDFTDSVDEFLREQAFRAIAEFGFAENESLFEKALFDPSRSVRTIVLACVGSESGDNFLEKAKVLLKDPDENVRMALTLAFGASGLTNFKPPIFKMLDDPSNRVVAGAFISLACYNDPEFLKVFYAHKNIKGIKTEISNIADDDRFRSIIEEIRVRAKKSKNLEVDLIFSKNDREFANELLRKLREALDPVLRMKAIEMLNIIATPELFTAILGVMKKDPFAEVRIQAMNVTVSIGRDEEVISALSTSLFDPAPNVRDRAAELLGTYRNPRALEALLHVLDTPDREFREVVTTSLSHLLRGDPDKNAEMVKSVPETKTRKIGMAWLMGKSRKMGAIKFLTSLLSDNDPEVRASAVGALGKFKKRQLINSLEKLIYDPNERVRAAAVNSIAATGDERAFEIVRVALQDIDEFVRTRAVIGMAKMNMNKTITLLRSKVNKFPELHPQLKAVLYASGEQYEEIKHMDSVAINIVDELCYKEEMLQMFRQSTDKQKRMHAFRILALTSNSDNNDFLSIALKDPVPEIREEAKKYSGVM